MIATIIFSTNIDSRINTVKKILTEQKLSIDHPDVLYFAADSKLGVEQAKKIREFLSIKPYSAQGRAVVVEQADNLTLDAQNALLKTLEEPPMHAVIILGGENEQKLLPTILSRCQIIYLDNAITSTNNFTQQIEKLAALTVEERFTFIEKLEEKEEFLKELIKYYQQKLHQDTKYLPFIKELLEAEKWQQANGNIRAILEYLMLKLY